MWDEGPDKGTSGLSPWYRATLSDAQEIVRQAKRYCPILPFEPSLNEVFEKNVAFYDDYTLVRLAPAGSARQEIYGFYAPGDFRPVDAHGKAFELLNAKVPLTLTSKTVLDYALVRLRFELPSRYLNDQSATSYRLAEVIRSWDDLHLEETEVDKLKQTERPGLIAPPEIEMIKEWDPYADEFSTDILRGKAYRVSATMIVYASEREVKLIKVLVQIDPLGSPIIRTDTRNSQTFTTNGNGVVTVTVPRHTATTLAVQDWESIEVDEFRQLNTKLVDYGVQNPTPTAVADADFVLRKSDLSFYSRYRLLEILRWDINHYQRAYALYRLNGDETVLHPLHGTSDIIYTIDHEDGELTLTEGNVDEYLRFFSWAVRGDAGPFYIPRTFREIPIRANFSGAEQAQLKLLDFSLLPVELVNATDHNYDQVAATAKFRRYAIVIYDQMLFEAWFAIEPGGMVHMVEDNPLAQIRLQTEAETGEVFLIAPAPTETTIASTPPLPSPEPELSAAQKAWLFEALTELKNIFLFLGDKETTVEKLREYLVSSNGQRFVTSLEKFGPLLTRSAPPDSTPLLTLLWSVPPSNQSVLPKDIAAEIPPLIEKLLPTPKVVDPDSLSWDQPTISSLLVDKPIVLSSALLEADKETHHDQPKQTL